ncbi:dienelactone hydrolase [Amylocarpus encephaloides]|uniref:Dienelactone hydrolase n=1 Tax=Amylocarpus encephaloides TaxID=45428 RepID=A0A9P7YDD3_9HELO|nr:dienelactone hydrolase [Amylocarpus encephaloides]
MSGITCPDCLTGSVKTTTPTGTVEKVHGVPTYVAKPECEPKAIIVIITDIFGWGLSNSRLLADSYAKEGGFLTYVPDMMNGHIPNASAMHAMESLLAPSQSFFTTLFYKPIWLIRVIIAAIPFLLYNGEKVVKPKVFNFHQALKNDPATSKLSLGTAGFCWGGKYAILLSQQEGLIDAAFTAHPSKMKFPDDWEEVKVPLSVAIGDVDMGIKVDMVKDIKKLLEEERKEGRHKLIIYPGAKHGFAVRANPKDECQTRSAQEAKAQALAWFGKWLV